MTRLENLAITYVHSEEKRIKAHDRVQRYSNRQVFNGRTYYRYQLDEEKAFSARQTAYKSLKDYVEKEL